MLQEVPSYIWRPDLAPLPDQLAAQQRTYLDAGLLDFDTPVQADRLIDQTFARRAK